jgi:hypothetical protein
MTRFEAFGREMVSNLVRDVTSTELRMCTWKTYGKISSLTIAEKGHSVLIFGLREGFVFYYFLLGEYTEDREIYMQEEFLMGVQASSRAVMATFSRLFQTLDKQLFHQAYRADIKNAIVGLHFHLGYEAKVATCISI